MVSIWHFVKLAKQKSIQIQRQMTQGGFPMNKRLIVTGIAFVVLLICGLIFISIASSPKQVYLSSFVKFYPSPPKSISEEFAVSFSSRNADSPMWTTLEMDHEYLKVCQTPFLLGCSWVKKYDVSIYKTDPAVIQTIWRTTFSEQPNWLLLGFVAVIILLVLYLLWDMFRPRKPITAAEYKTGLEIEAKQLEIRDRIGSIMERRKRHGIPWWWPFSDW